jgi:hypothetical protein
MHIVAIHSLKEDKENQAGALAAAMGVTRYEALARLRTPGSGPLTVAVLADKERALHLSERLQSSGFMASVLTAEEIETESRALIVRRFSLSESDLDVKTEKGDRISIPFRDVRLILRGTAVGREVTVEKTKKRSLSPGRAVLSGGMMITRTTKSVREVITEERQGFFNLYATDGPIFVFRENFLVYDSLGPELKSSRVANFAFLLAELRSRCSDALYDERLLTRAGQVALLGPSLSPEEHLFVATALLKQALGNRP